MDERENYDAANDSLIRREERAKDRREARAEAATENFKKEISGLFKQANVKTAIAKEADEATRDRDRINRMRARANEGTFRGYYSDEIITGAEDRPWERD